MKTLIRWVCTVCPDLSVRKIRIITVVLNLKLTLNLDLYDKRGGSNGFPKSMFLAEIRKNIFFLCENFMFTAVKITVDVYDMDVLT